MRPPPIPTSHQFKFDQTARSSSASSQPRKQASSTPRSVFGWAPSWPLSSMIREVCVCVQRSMLPCPLSVCPEFRSMCPTVFLRSPTLTTRAHIAVARARCFILFFSGRAEGIPHISVHLTCVCVQCILIGFPLISVVKRRVLFVESKKTKK
jgi:hypothetical protein